jgi:hypothetical protein
LDAKEGAAMKTLDLKREYKYLYQPPAKEVTVVEVPSFQFAMVDGVVQADEAVGEAPAFQAALEALYGISYTLKFMAKKQEVDPVDYPVMPLEGLWWVSSGQFDFTRREPWHFTAMIMQPEVVTAAMFAEARAQVQEKKGESAALAAMRLETFSEGLSVQVMHIGPYATEPATIARMQTFAQANGYVLRGKHHEIYTGDPRRAQPEKLKTVLRHPVIQVDA